MSRIDYVKSRLGDMILRDRGDMDENTAALVQSELREMLEQFFMLSAYSAEFSPRENGEIAISVCAAGRRLRRAEQK